MTAEGIAQRVIIPTFEAGSKREVNDFGRLPLHMETCMALGSVSCQFNNLVIAGGAAFDLLTTSKEKLFEVKGDKESGEPRDVDIICGMDTDREELLNAVSEVYRKPLSRIILILWQISR